MSCLLNLLLHHLDLATASLPLIPELLESLVVLASSWVTNSAQHARILLQPVVIVEVLESLCRLNAILGAHLLILVLSLHFLLVLPLDAVTHGTNLLDQLHVVSHNLQVVSLVDLTLNLEALLERVHRVLQEFLLVFVLLLDVWIDVTILGLLVFNELKKTVVHGNLQLLMIISVLHDLIDGILKAVDERVVVSDDVTISHDRLLDHALTHTQVFDHETKRGIHLVVLLKALVH